MDLKLIVLAGAKEGTQIPLKKDKFIIGRASECTLRAGSSAISRRHCAIVRKDDAWLVRDLGSRNGTFLNNNAVQEPTPLAVGDEIRVGPLHFRVEAYVRAAEGSKTTHIAPASEPLATPSAATASADDEPLDILRGKQPPVKSVGEVLERTARQSAGGTSEQDISDWLLGLDGGGDTLRETQTLSMEETTAISRRVAASEAEAAAAGKVPSSNGKLPHAEEAATDEPATDDKSADEKHADDATQKSGGWSFFKKKAGPAKPEKKAPGKLPPRPAELTKDSREAAADILREMTRRR